MRMKKNKDISVLAANLSNVHMEVNGNREVILEGSRGVVEYRETSIKINTGKYIISFQGRGLHIKCMTDCDIVIHGFITSIEYIM